VERLKRVRWSCKGWRRIARPPAPSNNQRARGLPCVVEEGRICRRGGFVPDGWRVLNLLALDAWAWREA
jgi:hypothetical protein